MGLISDTVNSDIILLAILTCTIAPFLFNRIYPPDAEQVRSGIIVVGQDQLAEYIIERLKSSGETIHAICPDESRIAPFKALGVNIIDGCDGIDTSLEAAGAEKARILLDLTANSVETLEVCELGRQKYGIPLIISRISDVEVIPQLQEMGIRVVQQELATAMALEGAIRYPTVFDVLVHKSDDLEVSEATVTNQHITGKRLGEIRLPGDALILSLQRENTIMVPHGDTHLRLQDRLGLIGSPKAVGEAIDLLRG